MKANHLHFYAQLAVVGILAAVGIIALTGEPTEDAHFLATAAAQLAVAFVCIGSAIVLGKKWQINRKLTATGLFQ